MAWQKDEAAYELQRHGTQLLLNFRSKSITELYDNSLFRSIVTMAKRNQHLRKK